MTESKIPQLMSGVHLTGHGGPEKLVWSDSIPVPTPGPNDVLVRVLAAGINNTDINIRIGWYAAEVTSSTDDARPVSDDAAGGWGGALDFPRIQGGDLCGEIVALGAEVTGFELGQRVTSPLCQPRPTPENPVGLICLGSEYDGAFAEFCSVPAGDIFDVSHSPLSDIEIAAIPCAYGTAEALLMRAGVGNGSNILVTGASGGVGMAAVELATLRGAIVTGMTSAAKAKSVLNAGANATVDRNGPLESAAYDCVIDVVGGPMWTSLIDALKPGGHYAVAGAIAGPIVEMDLRKIYLNDITLHGSTYQSPAVFTRLVDLINKGVLKPCVSKTYPLHQITQAQADFQTKSYPGKLVLLPQELLNV